MIINIFLLFAAQVGTYNPDRVGNSSTMNQMIAISANNMSRNSFTTPCT
ncbi:MAG: hypothetical protein PUC61_05595 [Bacteroidales bacterium]|nr:hypothetical protein [Bacteroidales bacterium]